LRRDKRRRNTLSKLMSGLRLLLITSVAAASLVALDVGQASAATGPLYAAKSDSLMCPIQTTATAYKQLTFNGLFYETKTIVRTTSHIGPNPYLFVGCRIGVKTQLRAYNGVGLATFDHTAVVGGALDPWGNEKWYTWYDELPEQYLDYAGSLVIWHEQR
jgi:hypothetical protein